MKNVRVYQIRVKVFLRKDVRVDEMLAVEADFIDQALAKENMWLEYHKKNQFKLYSWGGFYPIEKDGIYKKEQIYTITIRTVDVKLANYFSNTLANHDTPIMRGLMVENRIIPKKIIEEIYMLHPLVVKTANGYWRGQISLDEYERLLFENAVKKYNQYTGEKMDEDFQLYTNLTFLNRKPIGLTYKGIKLLGDKVNFKISDDPRAQELAYFLLGAGLGENCARGCGYCNYRWL